MTDTPFTYELADLCEFRDRQECERVRGIDRSDLTRHANDDFVIRIIDAPTDFYHSFAADLLGRLSTAGDTGQPLVLILPVGPVPQYQLAAKAINERRLSMRNVHTFNMDEYADQDGNTAPPSWPGSFQKAMWANFFGLIDEDLRPAEENIHFPTTDKISTYSDRIADLGGADVCYGGIGWSGHMAFWEPQLGHEFAGDLDAYRVAAARLVRLHPMTIMQNALHSFGGDWSFVPPMANTVGPRDILGARHRSFWLDGALGTSDSWQRFIARLVAHGPVSEFVPASMLQQTRCDFTIIGTVADNVTVTMA